METITEALRPRAFCKSFKGNSCFPGNIIPVEEAFAKQSHRPGHAFYYGRETFEMAAYALLQGENIPADRLEGDRKKYSGGKSCADVRQTVLQHVLFMSTWIAVRLWAQIHFAAVKYSCGRVLCISAR